MESVNTEMAEDYKETVSEFYNSLDSSARSAIDVHGGIGSQKLYLFQMGTLIARWACSPKLAVETASLKNIANSVAKVKNLTSLTDEEKRNAFLSDLTESLQNYIKANPDYESEVDKIITYIDSNYISGKSFYNAVKDIVTFCMDDGQTGMQLATVGVSTVSVADFCWFTGVVAVLQEAYFVVIDFIPSWLTITNNSITIVLTL